MAGPRARCGEAPWVKVVVENDMRPSGERYERCRKPSSSGIGWKLSSRWGQGSGSTHGLAGEWRRSTGTEVGGSGKSSGGTSSGSGGISI